MYFTRNANENPSTPTGGGFNPKGKKINKKKTHFRNEQEAWGSPSITCQKA